MSDLNERRIRQMFAILNKAKIANRTDRLTIMSTILHKPVHSTNELNDIEILAVVDVLNYWNRLNELEQRCTAITQTERDTA